MEKILDQIKDCIEDSKDWIPTLDGTEWKVQDEKATKQIIKEVLLPLIEKLHSIDSLREKEKFELDLIVQLQSLIINK